MKIELICLSVDIVVYISVVECGYSLFAYLRMWILCYTYLLRMWVVLICLSVEKGETKSNWDL